ncbi:hypothetical protein NKH04_26075 [Mesorhizobium sp. M1365]
MFVAFDILHLDGRNLTSLPLLQRKQALWQLVEHGPARSSTASISRAVR